MNDKNVRIYVFKMIFVLALVAVFIAGGTYAYWTWTSNTSKSVVFSTPNIENYIVYDEGESHFVGDIDVVDKFCDGVNTTMSFYKKTEAESINLTASINMDVNSIGENISSSTAVYWAVTKGDNTISCSTGNSGLMSNANRVNSGTFNGKTAGDVITLASDIEVTTTEQEFTIWIWIVESGDDLSLLSGETVDTNIWIEFEMQESESMSGEAFAIYSEDDSSLRFYKNGDSNIVTVGSEYNGRTVTAMYTGIEESTYSSSSLPPWNEYATNITNVVVENALLPVSTSYWFYDLINCSNINLTNLDTSNVTDMKSMFNNAGSSATKLEIVGIDKLNTSNVIEMNSMFYGCSSLTTLDLSNWNLSKVENLYRMFYGCSSLTTLDLSNWDTSNVFSVAELFRDCTNLKTLNIGTWVTSNITTMYATFYGCSSLTTIDLSNWDFSSTTQTNAMFYGCSSLTTLDVSRWNTSNITNMNSMFYNCSSLKELNVLSWDTGKVTNMYSMFYGCSSLSADCSNWNVTNVTGYYYFNTNAPGVIVPTWSS